MDSKVSSIPSLPKDDDDFWAHSQKETHKTVQKSCIGGHSFIRKANNAQCRNCGVGYRLMPGMDIVDGHIHIHGTRVI